MADIKENSKEVWFNSSVTAKVSGSEHIGEYEKALKSLRDIATKIAPEGRLVVALSASNEKFRPIEKLMANLAMTKTIYGEMAITKNAEVAKELGEIIDLVDQVNKIIDKRKAKRPVRGGGRPADKKAVEA